MDTYLPLEHRELKSTALTSDVFGTIGAGLGGGHELVPTVGQTPR